MDNDTFLAFLQVADKCGISIVTRGYDGGHGDDHNPDDGDAVIYPWTDSVAKRATGNPAIVPLDAVQWADMSARDADKG